MKILTFCLLAASLRSEVAVTVYNQDLGVVRETRGFDLKEGRQSLRFSDVAALIDPTSVSLAGPEGFKVLEQNFDFDLVSSDKLLAKYVDQDLKALGKGGKAFEGKLLSFDGGQLVLKKNGGGIDMVSRAELSSIEFPGLPGGLISRPTLVWETQSLASGAKDLTLTYMTTGLSWHAEYVALLSGDEQKLDLNAWVSVDNQSGATYEKAKLKLVAGDVHRAESPRPREMMMKTMAMAPAADRAFEQRDFFEYHLYTLSRPATLRSNQVKQVELLDAPSVPVKKVYTFDGSQGDKVKVELEIENKKASGLGMPLPAGKVRVYKSDSDGSSQFVGEDSLEHTAKDEVFRVEMGKAFDVVGKRTQKEQKQVSDRKQEQSFEVELRNRKKEAVKVVVVEHAWGDWSIEDSSQKFKKKDANTFEFEVALAPDEVKTLSYTIRTKY